ncbi:MAG: hypothetical protein AAFR61_21595 [Bacteroidota bacterium]
MARQKLSPELKKAISELPEKEKDKLLFRFVAKESILFEQLTFELLEFGETRTERREEVAEEVPEILERIQAWRFSPKLLSWGMRKASGRITRHVRVTKDKYGEVSLNILMLRKSLELYGEECATFPDYRTRPAYEYMVKRVLKIGKLLEKLHEDTMLDFRDDLAYLGEEMIRWPDLVQTAEYLGLDIVSLEGGDWP